MCIQTIAFLPSKHSISYHKKSLCMSSFTFIYCTNTHHVFCFLLAKPFFNFKTFCQLSCEKSSHVLFHLCTSHHTHCTFAPPYKVNSFHLQNLLLCTQKVVKMKANMCKDEGEGAIYHVPCECGVIYADS